MKYGVAVASAKAAMRSGTGVLVAEGPAQKGGRRRGSWKLTSSSRIAEGHQPGANRQTGLFDTGEWHMAGVVGRWAGEAREREGPGVSGCYCNGCGGRPKPTAAGYQSRCASEANLHDGLSPDHQNGILLLDRGGRRSALAKVVRWIPGSALKLRAFGQSRPTALSSEKKTLTLNC